jgi:hypothetical protein
MASGLSVLIDGILFTSVTSGGTLLDYWASVAVFSTWLLATLGPPPGRS